MIVCNAITRVQCSTTCTYLHYRAADLLESQIVGDTQHLTASILCHDLLHTKLPYDLLALAKSSYLLLLLQWHC